MSDLRHVEGFVCVGIGEAKWARRVEIFYGKAIDPQFLDRGFEVFATNGLVTFDTVEAAEAARTRIGTEMKSFDEVKIGWLRMEIVESDEEMRTDPVIILSHSLVVVWQNELGDQLIGGYIEGKPGIYPLDGARLDENGIVPISTHKGAIWIASEASRQSDGCPARLADFEFRWIR